MSDITVRGRGQTPQKQVNEAGGGIATKANVCRNVRLSINYQLTDLCFFPFCNCLVHLWTVHMTTPKSIFTGRSEKERRTFGLHLCLFREI